VRPDHHRSAYGRGAAYEVHKRFIYNRLERNKLVDEKLPVILQYVGAYVAYLRQLTVGTQAQDLYEQANVDILVRSSRPEHPEEFNYTSNSLVVDGATHGEYLAINDSFSEIAEYRRSIFNKKMAMRSNFTGAQIIPPTPLEPPEDFNRGYHPLIADNLPSSVREYLYRLDAPEGLLLSVELAFLRYQGDVNQLGRDLAALDLSSQVRLSVEVLLLRTVKE
jgi:hypothetical protein